MSTALEGITPYIYGTTRLGDEKISCPERVALARKAMEAGLWFHTSHTYGDALTVLAEAFAVEPRKTPPLIIKIGWDTLEQLAGVISQNLKPLGLGGMQLGQLCMGGELAESFASGGECYRLFRQLKEAGLVRGFVVEAFPWTSEQSVRALRGGYTEGIIDGFIFYLNPLQRFASNELWREINERQIPIIAMRTVAGGPVHKLRDVPGFAWKPYLQERAAQVAPIFERSGIGSWTEFCMRFARSFPLVRATVGSAGKMSHLEEYLRVKDLKEGLPQEMVEEICALQERWSEEVDMQAERWSM